MNQQQHSIACGYLYKHYLITRLPNHIKSFILTVLLTALLYPSLNLNQMSLLMISLVAVAAGLFGSTLTTRPKKSVASFFESSTCLALSFCRWLIVLLAAVSVGAAAAFSTCSTFTASSGDPRSALFIFSTCISCEISCLVA